MKINWVCVSIAVPRDKGQHSLRSERLCEIGLLRLCEKKQSSRSAAVAIPAARSCFQTGKNWLYPERSAVPRPRRRPGQCWPRTCKLPDPPGAHWGWTGYPCPELSCRAKKPKEVPGWERSVRWVRHTDVVLWKIGHERAWHGTFSLISCTLGLLH